MVNLNIKAKEINFIESNNRYGKSSFDEKQIVLIGKPVIEPISPEDSFYLIRNDDELPIPERGMVVITASEKEGNEGRYWGGVSYVPEFRDVELLLDIPPSINVQLQCEKNVFEELWSSLQNEINGIEFSSVFYPNNDVDSFIIKWDVSSPDCESNRAPSQLIDISLSRFKKLEFPGYSNIIHSLRTKRYDTGKAFREELDTNLKEAKVEGVSVFLLGLILFGVLKFLGVSSVTSAFVGVMAMAAYCYMGISCELGVISRYLFRIRGDINDNWDSFLSKDSLESSEED